ncbi:MAG: hypothetical protein F6J87_10275 [Spirulina sp. SIO3F2]|nr:hypothetical protein [Spirulina sp. SIO3F2]
MDTRDNQQESEQQELCKQRKREIEELQTRILSLEKLLERGSAGAHTNKVYQLLEAKRHLRDIEREREKSGQFHELILSLYLSQVIWDLLNRKISLPNFGDLANNEDSNSAQIKQIRRDLPITYWLLIPVSRMLKPEVCEEWIGDFYEEVVAELREMHYPFWVIDLVAVGKLGLLINSGIRTLFQGFFTFNIRRE